MQVSHSGLRGDWSLFIVHTPPRVITRRREILLMILLTSLQVVILLWSRYQHFDDPLTILDQTIFGSFDRMFCQPMQGSFLFLFKSPAPRKHNCYFLTF